MYESRRRYCGILLPVSSLPGPRGIGDLGGEARAFADFLSAALVTHWQILPLGPTGYGNSPYAARSAFAGNELLIDLEDLAARGFLEKRDLEASRAGGAGRIDYGLVASSRLPPLKKAARAFLDKTRKSADDGSGISIENFGAFCEKEAYWLDDYSLFQVLYEKYGDARWHSIWDGAEARRDPRALERVRSENKNKILEWKALQFFFECQWRRLKAYVNARGIAIIGDIPIFVAPDSADSWSRPDLLQMDTNGRYAFVSGVPPDYFSVTGQLWGNPVYDWEAMRAENYRWWKARIRRLMEQVDLFRIDHFRGFDEYWAVPAAAVTAETGEWKKGPGNGFFAALKAELGPLPVIAEDLGFMTESVALLRESQGFPGMKVCQFGFEDMRGGALDARHLFLPHNYGYLWAAYTGTHDNDTTAGWFDALDGADQKTAAAYLDCERNGAAAAAAMVRAVMASHAAYAIFPIQDILGLGSEARINTPASCGAHNWSWRLSALPTAETAEHFAALSALYSRKPAL